jgi:adenine deaminase
MKPYTLTGHIVDLFNRRIFPGSVVIVGEIIASIIEEEEVPPDAGFILPGFIDAHIHIESTLLVPSEFARLAVVHGTVATVSDPHEIANVLGIEGIRFMIRNGSQVPFHFYFGAPSCVPATRYETAGASINSSEIRTLFQEDELHYLSEMMNYPGVLSHDPSVMAKIHLAKEFNLPIDGHAPGLSGDDLKNYVNAGISTDHECFRLQEALEKIRLGMHILIREGSAAKNFEELHSLIKSHPEMVMLCSDDRHPHELVKGHINELVRRAIVEKGHDLMDVLRCACSNPVMHYHLDVGLLREEDSADLIVINNLHDFKILKTYIRGQLVAENGESLISRISTDGINQFQTHEKVVTDFELIAKGNTIRVIEAEDGQLVTKQIVAKAKIDNGKCISDPEQDILKLVVINRYADHPPAIGFIHRFGLKSGALASSVAHDSHNIIAVGVSDEDICQAVNAVIQQKGGIVIANGSFVKTLSLPVAGLMSDQDGYEVAEEYRSLVVQAHQLGSTLHDPFMTLSFMALLVIPSLKLSDQGLFDSAAFCFKDVFISA